MTHAHKLRDKRIAGKPMLKCKRCGLICVPEIREVMMRTKCPGRKG